MILLGTAAAARLAIWYLGRDISDVSTAHALELLVLAGIALAAAAVPVAAWSVTRRSTSVALVAAILLLPFLAAATATYQNVAASYFCGRRGLPGQQHFSIVGSSGWDESGAPPRRIIDLDVPRIPLVGVDGCQGS